MMRKLKITELNRISVEEFKESFYSGVFESNLDEEYLKNIIKQLLDSKETDCLVSTAHKAKGLEFKNVQLGSDYFWNKKQEEPLMVPAEARLLYVACTRAMEKLDISNMQPLFNRLFANKIRS